MGGSHRGGSLTPRRQGWLALAAGAAPGLLACLALPGARAALPPLLLLPLLPLGWLGAGDLLARAVPGGISLAGRLALGMGALHTLFLGIGLLGGYHSSVAWTLLVVAAALGAVSLRREGLPVLATDLPGSLCLAGCGALVSFLLLIVAVPAMDPDALTYHLALPDLWAATGAFRHVETLHYSYMPLGAEQGFLWARLLLPGVDAAWTLACGVSLAYGALLAAVTASLPGVPDRARPLAALLVLSLPVTHLVSALPYNDAYVSVLLVAAVCEILRWRREPCGARALVAGAFLGLALGGKYTALLAVPALLASSLPAVRTSEADGSPGPRQGLVPLGRLVGAWILAALAALLVWSPWISKTALATGNPVYPAAFHTLDGQPGGATAWDEDAARENARTAGHGAAWNPIVWLSGPVRLWTDPADFGVLPRVGPALLLCLPFLLWAAADRRSGLRGPGLAALVLYVTWSVTARNARYLLPCLALSLAVAACGALRLRFATGRFPAAARRVGLAVALILGLGLPAWGLVTSAGVFATLLRPTDFLAGRETAQEYLAARRPASACLIRASRALPDDARVLLLGETRAHYLGREYLSGGPIDPSPLLWLERVTGSTGFEEAVRAGGYGYVLVDPMGIARLDRAHDRYRGRVGEADALARSLRTRAEVALDCGRLRLYALAER